MKTFSLALCALMAFISAATLAAAAAIEAKCTACRSVARVLEDRIGAEKPRNAIDMRHRLDGTGQRYGRVINYKESELRATELLDMLCASMKDYSLVKTNMSGTIIRYWAKIRGTSADDMTNVTRLGKDESDFMTKKLESYCGSLLEEYEEDITGAIMKLKLEEAGAASTYICNTLTKACPQQQHHKKKAAAAEAEGEASTSQQPHEEL